jgi:hypothetical protein
MATYKLGQKWSNNFDYEGMLKTGAQVTVNTPLADLEKLHDSFEDVNYHTESNPLWNAIIAKREGQAGILAQSIEEFKELCQECLVAD